MRLNQYVALATGLSRRAADDAIEQGRVVIDERIAKLGDKVTDNARVSLDGKPIVANQAHQTIILNKPVGYVCSRAGQGSKTVYDLLPKKYHHLKPVGRLDKDSSGLVLMTNDGDLANQLTHPRYAKSKLYEVKLDKPLQSLHQQLISDHGISLDDGPSRLLLRKMQSDRHWQINMSEGRNRQIRRTFEALGYQVTSLHRTNFGPYKLGNLQKGGFISLPTEV